MFTISSDICGYNKLILRWLYWLKFRVGNWKVVGGGGGVVQMNKQSLISR